MELTDEYSVLVVDDGATDATVSEARPAGATVDERPQNQEFELCVNP
ncbi:hypothetical protein [Halorubrum coriense]|nr:hypothetical protein [Halorubrum coriense]